MRFLVAAPALALALALSGPVRADILPSGAKTIRYTYEIDNLAAHPDATFVVWPRSCGSDGEPLGDIRYVDETKEQREDRRVDYEVLGPGPRELLRYCGETSRIYALDAKSFPTDARVAAEDDWTLSWKKGQPYIGVRALDALTLRARVPFFAKARKAAFTFPYVLVLRRSSPIKAIHDVFTVRALDGARVEIAPVMVRYELVSGAREEIAWTGGSRPPPAGKPRALEVPQFGWSDDAGEDPHDDASDAAAPDAGATSVSSPTPDAPQLPWRAGLVVAVVAVVAVIAARRARRS